MSHSDDTRAARRAFCKFLAASPLWAAAGLTTRAAEIGDDELGAFFVPDAPLIESADQAVNVFDLEAVARHNLPPAHYGQIATGAGSGKTLMRNRAGFGLYGIHARRMIGVSKVDTSIELFGRKLAYPIMLSPIGSHRIANPEGELATAKGAAAMNANMIMSTFSSTAIEEVVAARGGPIWYQLYTTNNFEVTTALVKRAEAAGCTAVAVTVDTPAGRNTVTATRLARTDERTCKACHGDATGNRITPRAGAGAVPKPMFAGLNMQGVGLTSPSLTWDFIKRLKDVTRMKVVIKGLEAGEDAALAVASGADGIIISNHGGRATETGRGTIECVAEVSQAVAGRVPVLVDGGIRRGTDVFKALALGADAVGIGRPYIWGLATFGQQGVERVLDIFNNELRLAMVGCGTTSIRQITESALIDTGRRG
jgi:4-hydroxymandelate oxidase